MFIACSSSKKRGKDTTNIWNKQEFEKKNTNLFVFCAQSLDFSRNCATVSSRWDGTTAAVSVPSTIQPILIYANIFEEKSEKPAICKIVTAK